MISIILELLDLVVMQSKHTMQIYSIKKLATGRSVSKTLIKCNNNSEENDDEEKEPINIDLTEQKIDPEMMKMLLTLNDQI